MAPIEPYQYTIKNVVSCCGVGLHTGSMVNLTIKPATSNSGIRFVRSDLASRPGIAASVEQVVDTQLATTIGKGSATISTTEHLMAALRGAGIDNAIIEVDSHEVPIMDGSADPFVRLLQKGGRRRQQALRKIIRIIKPIEFVDGDKTIRIEPYDGFKVTGYIDFDDGIISQQSYSVDVTADRFVKEIARARTFGFVEQVEYLWANGLALGGTLDNVIAIHWDRRSVLNESGLRFDDEFIRHKVLDLIGDLALLGCSVQGHVVANRSGHALHLGLMQKIVATPEAWEFVSFKKRGKSIIQQTIKNTKKAAKQHFGTLLPQPVKPVLVSPSSCAA